MAKAPFKIKSPLDVSGNVGINIAPTDKYELLISGTAGIKISTGTTAERPASPEAGIMRYNTSLNQFEVYRNDGWRSLAQLQPGTNAPTSGVKYDMYMQLDEVKDKVADVFMHDGSKWVSLMPAINAELKKLSDRIDGITFDYGEY